MNILIYLVNFATTWSPVKRQHGATMIEYVLIVGVISIAAIAFFPFISDHIEGIFKAANQALSDADN